MAFFNKLKWVLGIAMVFVLITATNLLDRNNFLRVRDSIVTIYEDRLVAKDIIFDMSKAIQLKRIAVLQEDSVFFRGRNSLINADLANMIERFEQTKLTSAENRVVEKLKNHISELETLEGVNDRSDEADRLIMLAKLDRLDETLDKLSEIQMLEGRRQMKIGKSAVSAVELYTQIELYLLLVLAIVIQVIILYDPSKPKD